jgi:short-subunit dehydrogenase
MQNLTDKIVIVTGAASGIGRELAVALSQLQTKLILVDRNTEELNNTAQLLHSSSRAFLFTLDVSDKEAIIKFRDEVIGKFGYIDVLINNAGIALAPLEFSDIPENDFDKVININLHGTIWMSRAFLPTLLTRKESSLVNISSVFGLFGVPKQTAYCTSKYAVRGFTESLRVELKHSNIGITCVHPGGIKTNIVRSSIFYNKNDKETVISEFDKVAKTSPEKASKAIINAILKKKKRITIGPDAKLIYFFSRLYPNLLEIVASLRLKKLS